MADLVIPTSAEWGSTLMSLYEAYYGEDEDQDKINNNQECIQKPRSELCNLRSLIPQLRRQSVCVAGIHRDSLQHVKAQIQGLRDEPFALESFHVKQPSDLADGAFLVPKIVLVGIHCPGRKILDDEEDDGQLDYLYDEACRLGADIMVLYVGLPRLVYPPVRSAYHPKFGESVFPQQRLVKRLASDNCFMTLTENCSLNAIQKNMLREWLGMPSHMEEYLFSAGEEDNVIFEIENEIRTAHVTNTNRDADGNAEDEEDEDKKRAQKKKSRKEKKESKRLRRKKRYTFERDDDDTMEEQLIPDVHVTNPNIEMDMYKSLPMSSPSPGEYAFQSL